MPIHALSITYRDVSTAELDCASANKDLASSLVAGGIAREAALLGTCNRFEVYAAADDPGRLLEAVSIATGVERERFRRFEELAAVRHLFRVASSLESMIVGENQILGQIRRSEENARNIGTLGPQLRGLFVQARRAGRIVRRRVPLGRGSPSMASLAREVARKIFGKIEGRHVVVAGTGEIGILAARYFADSGARVSFAARSGAKEADAIAAETGGSVTTIDGISRLDPRPDIVVAATSSREYVIRPSHFPRSGRTPLLLVDLAVPRNIDPECQSDPRVYLYSVGDLEEIAAENRRRRAGLVRDAEAVLEERIEAWGRGRNRLAAREEAALLERVRRDWEARFDAQTRGEAARTELKEARRGIGEFFHILQKAVADEDPLKSALSREMVRGMFHGD